MRADPEKVPAIMSLRPPKTKSEVKSFLGMDNYLQQFLPKLSEKTKVIRNLDKKGSHNLFLLSEKAVICRGTFFYISRNFSVDPFS